MATTTTPRNGQDRTRNRWMWLLLLLALLMSFACVFCSTQLALSSWPDLLTPASLLTERQADYSTEFDRFRFEALDPSIMALAATDTAYLQTAPSGDGISGVISVCMSEGIMPV